MEEMTQPRADAAKRVQLILSFLAKTFRWSADGEDGRCTYIRNSTSLKKTEYISMTKLLWWLPKNAHSVRDLKVT